MALLYDASPDKGKAMKGGREDGMDRSEGSLSNISIILCRVRESGNVGSVCRAMKTMGVERLILADCPIFDEEKVRMMAVHAGDVFEKAARFPTLESSLAGFPLSAGFTRRKGEKRKASSAPLRDFAAKTGGSPPAPLALVFGSEKDGLTDEELGLCSMAVHIPSSEAFPSLNIAQAVQVACYEFFAAEQASARVRPDARGPAVRAEVDAGVQDIVAALSELGFFRQSGDAYLRRFLRDLCERSGASDAEVGYLRKTFLKTIALARKHPWGRT